MGAEGRVVATDLEVELLKALDAPNLSVRHHDILVDALEENEFHLVHAGKVLEHLPAYKRALQRVVTAARSGGWVLVEDADLVSVFNASRSDPAFFKRAYRAFVETMVASGYQADLGLRLSDELRALGLRDVQLRGWTSEWTGAGVRPSVFLRSFEKIRDRVVANRRLSAGEADLLLSFFSGRDRDPLRSLGSKPVTDRRVPASRLRGGTSFARRGASSAARRPALPVRGRRGSGAELATGTHCHNSRERWPCGARARAADRSVASSAVP